MEITTHFQLWTLQLPPYFQPHQYQAKPEQASPCSTASNPYLFSSIHLHLPPAPKLVRNLSSGSKTLKHRHAKLPDHNQVISFLSSALAKNFMWPLRIFRRLFDAVDDESTPQAKAPHSNAKYARAYPFSISTISSDIPSNSELWADINQDGKISLNNDRTRLKHPHNHTKEATREATSFTRVNAAASETCPDLPVFLVVFNFSNLSLGSPLHAIALTECIKRERISCNEKSSLPRKRIPGAIGDQS